MTLTLKGTYTDIDEIRRMVFAEVAKVALRNEDLEAFNKIPYIIIDSEEPTYRSSIFKERAIVAARIRMALGLDYEEKQEHRLLSDIIKEKFNQQDRFQPPLVSVISFACEKCPTKKHYVTDNCRKCMAHPCSIVCPVDAISMEEHRAVINHDTCINCGRCREACPYNAIVHYVRPCADACGVDAIESDEHGRARIIQDRCVSCGQCIIACPFGAIADKSMIYPLLKSIKKGNDVRAVIAPSFIGQFGPLASPERIVAAVKNLGIKEVGEVSLGADASSLHEADLYQEKVPEQQDFLGTSCCPSWTYVADKHVPETSENISPSHSPMVVSAQYVKGDNPDSEVVFIGPCISKKIEMIDENVRDYVDYVITFEELAAIFVAANIELTHLDEEEEINDASVYGRGYANAGGVARAIEKNLEVKYDKKVETVKADGLSECKTMLTKARDGKLNGCLLEGMACPDGCVGGPGALLENVRATKNVNDFSEESPYPHAGKNDKLNQLEEDKSEEKKDYSLAKL